MYKAHQTYVKPETEIIDIITENYSILLMLEHFGINFSVGNKTAQEICLEYGIAPEAFLIIANLYNGFYPPKDLSLSSESLISIIDFLKNSHLFFQEDKYPELIGYIRLLKASNDNKTIDMMEQFFNDYIDEVNEHFNYENNTAFPFFVDLLNPKSKSKESQFSVKEYRDHHSDIETKLEDLRNLLLKHIHLENLPNIQRKFIRGLFGLEADLRKHSIIEEMILVPSIEKFERLKNA